MDTLQRLVTLETRAATEDCLVATLIDYSIDYVDD